MGRISGNPRPARPSLSLHIYENGTMWFVKLRTWRIHPHNQQEIPLAAEISVTALDEEREVRGVDHFLGVFLHRDPVGRYFGDMAPLIKVGRSVAPMFSSRTVSDLQQTSEVRRREENKKKRPTTRDETGERANMQVQGPSDCEHSIHYSVRLSFMYISVPADQTQLPVRNPLCHQG